MKVGVYAILDDKVGAYMAPFCARSRGEAIRIFTAAVGDRSSPFYKFPADFRLFAIGGYDDSSGLLVPADTVEYVIAATEVLEISYAESYAESEAVRRA